MLFLYAACLALGGGFVLLSSFAGGDSDGDFDSGEGGDALLWLPFLSWKFWFYAMASFGLTGLVMTLLLSSSLPVLPIALLMGVLVGTGVHVTFRQLARSSGSSMLSSDQWVGVEGVVHVAIRGSYPGQVRVSHGAHVETFPAIKESSEEDLEAGDRIVIVGFTSDGKVRVMPARTFLEGGTHG